MISGPAIHAQIATDRKLRRDLRTLACFIDIYCRGRHGDAERGPVRLRNIDVEPLHGGPLRLCRACARLAAHAFMKRLYCPYEPKPSCKKCPTPCYAPEYRARIREVMRYSGRRLVLAGRLHYLWRLWF